MTTLGATSTTLSFQAGSGWASTNGPTCRSTFHPESSASTSPRRTIASHLLVWPAMCWTGASSALPATSWVMPKASGDGRAVPEPALPCRPPTPHPDTLPVPNDSGRWALALGTVALNPIGMDWQATIELPHAIAAVTAWALIVASGDAGRTAEAASVAYAGYANGIRGFDAAHMRFVIADGHVGASCCPGRVGAAADTAERMRQQAAHLPGSAH
jgi:hypothetical protein